MAIEADKLQVSVNVAPIDGQSSWEHVRDWIDSKIEGLAHSRITQASVLAGGLILGRLIGFSSPAEAQENTTDTTSIFSPAPGGNPDPPCTYGPRDPTTRMCPPPPEWLNPPSSSPTTVARPKPATTQPLITAAPHKEVHTVATTIAETTTTTAAATTTTEATTTTTLPPTTMESPTTIISGGTTAANSKDTLKPIPDSGGRPINKFLAGSEIAAIVAFGGGIFKLVHDRNKTRVQNPTPKIREKTA